MSLAGTVAYWDAARKKVNSNETWLVKLYYDNEDAADYIGISDRDITVSSKFYHGVVLDFGSLSESINLLNSSSAVGNIDITCTNKYGSGTLGAELWPTGQGASAYYYINRKVEIYSRFGDTTALTDCRLIYEGRLFNIQQSDYTITLNIEEKKPQDYITIPQTKTSDGKIYFPVVYGDYTASTAYDTETSYAVHPYKVHSICADNFYCPDSISQAHTWHYYDKNIDKFSVLNTTGVAARAFAQGGYVSLQEATLARNVRFNLFSEDGTSLMSNPNNAYDRDTGTYAFTNLVAIYPPLSHQDDFIVDVPTIDGVFTELLINIYTYGSYVLIAGTTGVAQIVDATYGDTHVLASKTGTSTGTWAAGWGTENDQTANYVANNESLTQLTFNSYLANNNTAGDHVTLQTRIYDVQIKVTVLFDKDGSANGSAGDKPVDKFYDALDKVEYLYSASDGLDADFTDGSGTTAKYCHEIFRDMLDRFAGFDAATASMINYAALNTARTTTNDADWLARLWILEPESLQDILDKLQFEGGFIFKYYPGGGKFIFVKDTYGSGDVQHNITKNDYTELSTSLTDFNEIITDTTYNYTKHPATGDFINQQVYTNTTARGNLWPGTIAGEENKAKVDLDYLVDSPYDSATDTAPNECIALYYDNIRANPKILVSCEIINPELMDLEIGDIVTFSESLVNHGKTTTVYYMVVGTDRSVGRLSIQCREVYDV